MKAPESPTTNDRDIPESEFLGIAVVNSTLRAERKARVRVKIQDDLARERRLRSQKPETKKSKENPFHIDALEAKEERDPEISTIQTPSTQVTPSLRSQPLPISSTPVISKIPRSGCPSSRFRPQPDLAITKSTYRHIVTQSIPLSRPKPPPYPPPNPPCPCDSPSCVARRQTAESPKLTYQSDVRTYKS
jgi:hypothetical protein